jgi:hypothetical protein
MQCDETRQIGANISIPIPFLSWAVNIAQEVNQMLLTPKLKFVAVAIALMALISTGVWIEQYASAAEQPAAPTTAPATSPAPAVASEITVDSDFDCGTPGDAVVDSPDHVTITLQRGPLDWWMFRLKGVAGKTVTIEIMLNPSSARASLNKWRTLTPVYGDAADLSDPATFATGPLDVDVLTDRPGIRNPTTDQQTWHYIKDSSLIDTRHFKMTQTFDIDPVYIAGRIPYPPGYSAKFIDGIAANPLAKVIDLGKTPESRPIRIVQIGATDDASQASKPGILICGGEQAYQPDGMWACQGCMEFLLGDSDKAKALRDQCVFFIIPMLDPDGTAHSDGRFIGSFRAGRANPTAVAYANWLQSRVLAGGRIDLVLELHSLQSGESEHLQRVEMKGLPPERPALIEAFQRIIARQFTTNKLTVFRANMNGGIHRPYRFSGWVAERLGALDIIYEVNAQAPAGHLTLSQLKDTGRLFAQAAGEFFASENGARLLASADKARANRQARWNGNPATNPSQDAIESEEAAAENSQP